MSPHKLKIMSIYIFIYILLYFCFPQASRLFIDHIAVHFIFGFYLNFTTQATTLCQMPHRRHFRSISRVYTISHFLISRPIFISSVIFYLFILMIFWYIFGFWAISLGSSLPLLESAPCYTYFEGMHIYYCSPQFRLTHGIYWITVSRWLYIRAAFDVTLAK